MNDAREVGPLQRFVTRFDEGQYWLAHEELEPLWLRTRAAGIKGLIHLAAGMVHAERGNANGARVKFASALVNLRDDGDFAAGLDREQLEDELERVLQAIDTPPLPRLQVGERLDVVAASLETEKVPYRARRYREGYRLGRDPRRRD